MSDIANRCIAEFRAAFEREPDHLAYAPGRVNLIGDHTDYCDGLVMPAALSAGCVCAVGAREGELRARAGDLGESAVVAADRSLSPESMRGQPHWMRYVAGTFAAMRDATGAQASGVDLAMASSIPPGSGLSSSAAVEVSVATALEALWGQQLSGIEKARACQLAEHEYADVPCGLMDQMASIFGKRGKSMQIDFATNSVELISLPDEDRAVFVIFETAVGHSNASGEYAKRRAACERAAAKMGGNTLRDVERVELPSDLTEDERLAATHVLSENQRVLDFAGMLQAGELESAGRLMNESHESLSSVYRVSCHELDVLADLVRSSEGVFGARMTGGGFGGWVVALVETSRADALLSSAMRAYENATGKVGRSLVVHAGDGARVLS